MRIREDQRSVADVPSAAKRSAAKRRAAKRSAVKSMKMTYQEVSRNPMSTITFHSVWVCGFLLCSLGCAFAADAVLPEGSAPKPVASSHFPDRLHTFVWRNWNAVEPAKLAKILGTSEDNVRGWPYRWGCRRGGDSARDEDPRLHHAHPPQLALRCPTINCWNWWR